MIEATLASIGLMCLLKYGSIFDFIRNPLKRLSFFETLFNCSLCLGFWTGAFVAWFNYYVSGGFVEFLLPFIAAPACWLFDTVLGVLQSLERKLDEEDPQP